MPHVLTLYRVTHSDGQLGCCCKPVLLLPMSMIHAALDASGHVHIHSCCASPLVRYQNTIICTYQPLAVEPHTCPAERGGICD